MKTKEEIRKFILKDLCQIGCDHITPLCDFDGLWLYKEKALNHICTDIKSQLSDYYEIMNEVSIKDIVDRCHETASTWLNKYGNFGRGRTSHTQLNMCELYCSDEKSEFIVNNFDILTRTRIFVGLCLGIGSKFELQGLILHVIKNEMEQHSHIDICMANTIFRIRLLESYLKETEFENLVHETNLNSVLGDNVSLFKEEYNNASKKEKQDKINFFINEQKSLSDKEAEINKKQYDLLIDLIKYHGAFNDINNEVNMLFNFTLGIGRIEQVYIDNDKLFISGKNNSGFEVIDEVYERTASKVWFFCSQILKKLTL